MKEKVLLDIKRRNGKEKEEHFMMISDKRLESDEILCKRGRKVKRNFEREEGLREGEYTKIKKTEKRKRSNEIVHERPVFKKLQTFLMLYSILL